MVGRGDWYTSTVSKGRGGKDEKRRDQICLLLLCCSFVAARRRNSTVLSDYSQQYGVAVVDSSYGAAATDKA